MYLLALFVSVTLASCNGCTTATDKDIGSKPLAEFEVIPGSVGEFGVEQCISADREFMNLHYAQDYRWYETCITLANYLDDEACDGTVETVENVFQVVTVYDKTGGDSEVVFIKHAANKDTEVYSQHGFWIEDFPLTDQGVKLTYKQAYDKITATNSPKPHSRKCVLRNPVGPNPCNPQWVFGNIKAQLWVDAVTGEVNNSNPAFDGFNVSKPPEAWP